MTLLNPFKIVPGGSSPSNARGSRHMKACRNLAFPVPNRKRDHPGMQSPGFSRPRREYRPLDDLEGFAAAYARVKSIGYSGRLTINACFSNN